MTENRFLGCTFIEGIILTVLGLCILILPKLTSMTFGVMLSLAFIAYGIYKIVSAFINKVSFKNIFFEILLGALLTTVGVLLLFVPNISLLWLVALTGVYFVLESVNTSSIAAQIRNIFNFSNCKWMVACALFIIGLIILLGLPSLAFWTVAVLSGVGFLIKGMAKMSLFFANKNSISNINKSCHI